MSKLPYISLLCFAVVFTSCKKDVVIEDREDLLKTDTATMIFRSTYVSHTATDLEVDLDMVTFNGLLSETDYTNQQFYDSSDLFNVNYTISAVSTNAPSTTNNFSTVILLNLAEKQWYEQDFVGVHMRRFFEQTEASSNHNVALSSFAKQENTFTRFHTENKPDIFDNSWQYNVDQFYMLTNSLNQVSAPTNISYLSARLLDVIDTLVAAPSASGDLSITLMSDYDFQQSGSQTDIDAIIASANTNNVHINLLGSGFSDQLRTIASSTGGFVCTYELSFSSQTPLKDRNETSAPQVALQNLIALLTGQIKMHGCHITATYTDSDTWQSGNNIRLPINYNGRQTYVDIIIP